jgi:hypothetical protein
MHLIRFYSKDDVSEAKGTIIRTHLQWIPREEGLKGIPDIIFLVYFPENRGLQVEPHRIACVQFIRVTAEIYPDRRQGVLPCTDNQLV